MHDGILNKVSAECVAVKLSVQLNCSANRTVRACLLKLMVSIISHRIRTNLYMGRCFEAPTGHTCVTFEVSVQGRLTLIVLMWRIG